MTTSDWIALSAGIYASIVATCALVWNIIKEKHNVTVRVKYACGTGMLVGREMVSIEIINNGRHPINIQEVGFVCSDRKRLIDPEDQNNLGWLKDGDGISFFIAKPKIDEMVRVAKEHKLKIIGAYVRDSTSRYYDGKIDNRADWFH